MGLSRAFVQPTPVPTTEPINKFPNNATITDASLGTVPSVILSARPRSDRRGLVIENDGSVPMIFGYGTTVSVGGRTALLFPNDVWDDEVGWQGPVAAASVGGIGAANFTEMVFI